MTDGNYQNHVKIVWYNQINIDWNQICISAIEQFGLPGDRYITDASTDYMTWSFRSAQDALLFRLKHSEVVA